MAIQVRMIIGCPRGMEMVWARRCVWSGPLKPGMLQPIHNEYKTKKPRSEKGCVQSSEDKIFVPYQNLQGFVIIKKWLQGLRRSAFEGPAEGREGSLVPE